MILLPAVKDGRMLYDTGESDMADNKIYHNGHRQRLRQRYIENGIDALMEHEILELMLFYCLPRVDTKPLAHELIDHFGSLKSVLGASFRALKDFGLSDNCATFLCFNRDLLKYLRNSEIVGRKLSDYAETGRLLAAEFADDSVERILALFLDADNTVSGIKMLGEGSIGCARINMRTLAEECFYRNSSKVVLAHNHPSGKLKPSADDFIITTDIEDMLSRLEIVLVEHYIVADGTYLGIKNYCEQSNLVPDTGRTR